jgi:NhaP-type Na+/H+ or K+/H+ antiporter
MDVLIYLTGIALILLLGLLISILSEKLKISNILLLIIAGIGSSFIEYNGNKIFDFPPIFLVSIATLALVMIVFDGSSRMKFREIDEISYKALKLTGLVMFFNFIFGGLITYLLFFNKFTTTNIILSLVFATLMAGTDPGSVFIMFKNKTSKVLEFLKVEAIVNTPIVVLIPFILLEFIIGTESISIISKIGPFIQIVTGIGAGIVIGLIIFKVMKRSYSEQLSAVGLLTGTLLTYILAENLGGNGVLGVATLGLMFGNMYVKKKTHLSEFSSILSTSLEIMVFVLVGAVIKIPWEPWFFIKSIVLFIIFILCRYLSLKISIGKEHTTNDLIFMSLNMSKGIAIAAVTFTIALISIDGMQTLVNLILITMIYSLIVSTITTIMGKKLIKIKDVEETISNPVSPPKPTTKK